VKIERIRTYRLEHRLAEPFAFSQWTCDARRALLVEVVADEGLSGWGECYGPAAVIQTAVTGFYAPQLLGRDPLRTDVLWHALWQSSLDFARRGVMMAAISGLDMALWDLKGKVLGLPMSELMGGRFRDQVPCYATGMYFKQLPEDALIDALVCEAAGYWQQGFRAMKIKVGKNISFDLRLIAAVRRTLPGTTLMADANHAFDLAEAIQVGRVLEEHGFAWFEEPLSPELPAAYRQLHDQLGMALAAGECEQTRWGFQALLAPGGVQVAQPDLAYCGGPSEALKIRALAAALGINVVPHAWGTMLNLAAAAHFLASGYQEPGRAEVAAPILECDRTPNPLRDDLFENPLSVQNGIALVPTSPGLGMSVDRAAMNSFCVQQTAVP
jgi:D-galactarolactone cycloisomerase